MDEKGRRHGGIGSSESALKCNNYRERMAIMAYVLYDGAQRGKKHKTTREVGTSCLKRIPTKIQSSATHTVH